MIDELAIQKIRRDREACVIKANKLIQESRFNLSTQQQKMVLYLISKITPYDEDFEEYEFTIMDFCKVCGITLSGTNYADLKEQIKRIADKSLWVEIRPGEETLLRWIEKPYIDTKSGIIRIRLDRDMKPFLLRLKQNYTQYELIWTLHFKSKYSIRLYELIKSIHFRENETYIRRFELEELRRLLGADTYARYKDFRVYALQPAVDEINEYSDKNISWKPIKDGRAVAYIEFTITTKGDIQKSFVRDLVETELELNQLSLFDIAEDDTKSLIEQKKAMVSKLEGL